MPGEVGSTCRHEFRKLKQIFTCPGSLLTCGLELHPRNLREHGHLKSAIRPRTQGSNILCILCRCHYSRLIISTLQDCGIQTPRR